jgi:ribosomal protein S4
MFSNISLNFLSNKFYFWFDSIYSSNYSVLSKFEISVDFDDSTFSFKKNILRLVYIKKKFGFFKKDSKTNHFFLYKVNFLKNLTTSKVDFFENDVEHKNFNKFIDLKSSAFSLFYRNRKLLKKLFFFKNIKQNKTTKLFSKILKINFNRFISFVEYSLFNVLIKCKFCFTKDESIFLIKNKFIFVNGLVVTNPIFFLKKSDVVQVIISDCFFDFIKINSDKKLKTISLLKHVIWRNNRFANNFYKQSYTKVPDWVLNTSSFYEDVPTYFEVDYTILSACILKNDVNFIFYNNSLLNFINVFMLRNYNWNYLT